MGICANLCVRMHVCECMSACACVLVLASECICVYAHAMKSVNVGQNTMFSLLIITESVVNENSPSEIIMKKAKSR